MSALTWHTELDFHKTKTNFAFTAKQVNIFLTFWANERLAAFKVSQKLPWNIMKPLTEEHCEDTMSSTLPKTGPLNSIHLALTHCNSKQQRKIQLRMLCF